MRHDTLDLVRAPVHTAPSRRRIHMSNMFECLSTLLQLYLIIHCLRETTQQIDRSIHTSARHLNSKIGNFKNKSPFEALQRHKIINRKHTAPSRRRIRRAVPAPKNYAEAVEAASRSVHIGNQKVRGNFGRFALIRPFQRGNSECMDRVMCCSPSL